MRKHNGCLKLIAIDAELELKSSRDEGMAEKLAELVGDVPVLALLGSLHTLKKVEWNPFLTKKEPYVAEILVVQGHNVKSYPQIWMDHACYSRTRLFLRTNQMRLNCLIPICLRCLMHLSLRL